MIAVDPVMSQLDFGIPLLYNGKKKTIDGTKELHELAKKASLILISQGFDDHAHTPTLKRLAKIAPNMKYLAPPSAKSILLSCGVAQDCIQTILPGESFTLSAKGTEIEIIATSGALLGPPWQQKENGYFIKPGKGSKKVFPSIYYEPHCMYDEQEVQKYQADVVITPIVAQELPKYTLVAGGEKALRLAKLLKAKTIVPMANGELKQGGILAQIIQTKGSLEEFQNLLKGTAIQLADVSPGVQISL